MPFGRYPANIKSYRGTSTRDGTNVPGARDRQPCYTCWSSRILRYMAQRSDWVPLTAGLARMEGENATYIRASDNLR